MSAEKTEQLLRIMASELPQIATFLKAFSRPYSSQKKTLAIKGNTTLDVAANNLDDIAARAREAQGGVEQNIPALMASEGSSFHTSKAGVSGIGISSLRKQAPKLGEQIDKIYILRGRNCFFQSVSLSAALLGEIADECATDSTNPVFNHRQHPAVVALAENGHDPRDKMRAWQSTLVGILKDVGQEYRDSPMASTSPLRFSGDDPIKVSSTLLRGSDPVVHKTERQAVAHRFHQTLGKYTHLFERGEPAAKVAMPKPGM